MVAKPSPLKSSFVCGLDLGQAADHSALAVLEFDPIEKPVYTLRHLERFNLGVSYPDQVRAVETILNRESELKPGNFPLRGSILGIDAGGVGRAVYDLIREAKLPAVLRPVTITGGQTVSFVDGFWRVPKADLVAVLQVLFQRRRIRWHESLPHVGTLTRELMNFRATFTESAHQIFSAREGEHDDLLLAVAVAAWIAERSKPSQGFAPHVIQTRDPALRY